MLYVTFIAASLFDHLLSRTIVLLPVLAWFSMYPNSHVWWSFSRYPTDSDKQMLAKQTGLTRNQVSCHNNTSRILPSAMFSTVISQDKSVVLKHYCVPNKLVNSTSRCQIGLSMQGCGFGSPWWKKSTTWRCGRCRRTRRWTRINSACSRFYTRRTAVGSLLTLQTLSVGKAAA